MSPRFLAGEVWAGLRRNISMAISVVIVTMVSMVLLGLGLLAQRQADTMKGYWYDRIQVSIYLCTKNASEPNCEGAATTDAERAAIETQLRGMPEVKEVFYETEQEAYDHFKEAFRNSPVLGSIQVGDIPPSFRVQLQDPTKFAVVSSQFESAAGVAKVQDQEKVLGRIFAILDVVKWGAVGLALIMGACAALLMAVTIRQAAFIRRREIGIMRLVGASNWSIRMPFIIEMVLVASVGAAAAVGALYVGVRSIFNLGFSQIALRQAFIGAGDVLPLAPWMVGGVILLAILTALVTLRRYLRV